MKNLFLTNFAKTLDNKIFHNSEVSPNLVPIGKQEIINNPTNSPSLPKIKKIKNIIKELPQNKIDTTFFEKNTEQGPYLTGLFLKFRELFNNSNYNLNNTINNVDDDKKNEPMKELLPFERASIIGLALKSVENGKIYGARHCTDWVSKLYKESGIKGGADSGPIVYNAGVRMSNNKYFPIHKASLNDTQKAKAGDYVMIENGNKTANTHGAVVLKNYGDGRIKVASYPGSGRPKIEVYDLASGQTPDTQKRTANGDRIGNLVRIKAPLGVA